MTTSVSAYMSGATLEAVFGQPSQRITELCVVSEPDVEPYLFACAVGIFGLGYSVR